MNVSQLPPHPAHSPPRDRFLSVQTHQLEIIKLPQSGMLPKDRRSQRKVEDSCILGLLKSWNKQHGEFIIFFKLNSFHRLLVRLSPYTSSAPSFTILMPQVEKTLFIPFLILYILFCSQYLTTVFSFSYILVNLVINESPPLLWIDQYVTGVSKFSVRRELRLPHSHVSECLTDHW